MKKYAVFSYLLVLLFVHSFVATAHVGSSGVIVQKQAGKYQLLISVQPPDVVPGTAKVTVFVEQGRVSNVGARPIYFYSGDKGAPTNDVLTAVGDNRYEGDLWLMESGSSSVEISINGPDGKQQVVVPVAAVATALRTMPPGTGWGLAAMGLLLVVMLVTIIGASNADGIVAPGLEGPGLVASKTLRRRRWVGMGVGLLITLLILTGWRSWWNSTAEDYRNYQLYRPTKINASVSVSDAQRLLTVQFDTTGFGANEQIRRRFSFMLPDHGKLMHTFLVRLPGLDAFAHLHPIRRDTLNFQSTLPPLPGGKYLLFSDVVYRNGFTETLTDTLEIPARSPGQESAAKATHTDKDDSWLIAEPMGESTPGESTVPAGGRPSDRPGIKAGAVNVPQLDDDMVVCGKPGASMKLQDESTMLWMDKESPVLEAGKLYNLKFAVADAQGKATAIEPYLGMPGHAAILRSDGSVYIHLHPVGTYSMAAERSLSSRLADTARMFQYPSAARFSDSIDTYIAHLKTLPDSTKNKLLAASMPGMSHVMKTNNMVEFPYAFPRAGHYRIWVQVQRKGQVLTGVFDTDVKEALF